MQSVSERILQAVAEERQRIASRRGFLKRSAVLAGGGVAAAAFVGGPFGAAPRAALAQDFTDDLDILNYALTLELLEADFYSQGLDAFSEEDFDEFFGDDEDDDEDDEDEEETPEALEAVSTGAYIRERIADIGEHEDAHVEFITTAITDLGLAPVEGGEFDFGDAFDSIENFLETAAALENTGVSAYLGAAPFITDSTVLAAAATIATVEARHAAYLNLLNEETPFPDAFDEGLTREEVLAIADDFIVTAPAADDAAATDDTDTADATVAADDATVATDDGADATEAPADETVVVTEEATVEATVEDTVEATVAVDETAAP